MSLSVEEINFIMNESIVKMKSEESWIENANSFIKILEKAIREHASNGYGEISSANTTANIISGNLINHFPIKEQAFYIGKYFADRGFYVEISYNCFLRGYYINLVKWHNIINGNRSLLEYITGCKRNCVVFKNESHIPTSM